MSGKTLTSLSQSIQSADLQVFVKEVAERFGEIRRITEAHRELWQRLQNIASTPSTEEQMVDDWLSACAFLSLKIIEGDEIALDKIEPTSFCLLEDAWLKKIKELKAYYIWEMEGGRSSDECHLRASSEIRSFLLERPRAAMQSFGQVQAYLADRYLKDGESGRLDDAKPTTNMLIAKKAHQIWKTSGSGGDEANWFRAKLYVTMFYENIIGAVTQADRDKTRTVLKALEFGKPPANRYQVINGLETAIVVNFLNKEIVREILSAPELHDFSIEPVEDWPVGVGDPRLRHDEDANLLIYEGVMPECEKETLMNSLAEHRHRVAVEKLYEQSQFRPFEAMIL